MKEKIYKPSFNKPSFITDSELLTEFFFYFRTLRDAVPTSYLKDSCSGIMALIFNLRNYLAQNNLSDYGNNKK